MIKNVLPKLFRWRPSRETLIPTLAGIIVFALSAAMIPFRETPWFSIVLRDVGMIFMVGIIFPLYYILRSGGNFAEFGLTLKRWYIVLPIDFVLGILLLFLFLSKTPPFGFCFDALTLARATYILLAGIFEVVFFFGFQRTLFERAFGIVPGIVLAAFFYAVHHLGFQPEFGKLFLVGLMYATVFRLGNSAFLIYPFFWGVGACYDVLIQSQEVSPILHPGIRSLYLAVLILVVMIWTWKNARTMDARGRPMVFRHMMSIHSNKDTIALMRRMEDALRAAHGKRLHAIVLFGSEARGESVHDSDIDVLVLLDGPIHYANDLLENLSALYPLAMETGRRISAKPVDAEHFENADIPLLCAVREEGLRL